MNYLDNPIPLFKVYMRHDVDELLGPVLHSGYIAQGPKVEEFEYRLRSWFDVKNVLTVNSGTSALQLACTLAGVYPNITHVISTPMTCTATNTAIRAVGGEIIWADIDPVTGNIDPTSVEEILQRARPQDHIKAIMAVDWGGVPCDWDALRYLADKYGVALIEDAAHAFGATYHGEHVGHLPDFTCFSFQAIKHLTAGDGGALICREDAAHNRGKLLRWFGIDREQPRKDFRCEADVLEPGFKYHMNDINATIGLANLEGIRGVINTHRSNAEFYTSSLIRNHYSPVVPRPLPNTAPSWWLYTLRIPERVAFMTHMQALGIAVSQVHARNDTHTMFKKYRRALPGVDSFAAGQVSIPVGWWVGHREREYILEAMLRFFR